MKSENGNSCLPESGATRPRKPGDCAGASDNTSTNRKNDCLWAGSTEDILKALDWGFL